MKKILLFLILALIGHFSYAQSFGSIDNTFDNGSGTDNDVAQIAIQSDGKILMVGDFSSYNGNAAGQIIRLNADGTRDNTFITSVTGQVKCLAIQNDGKIVIGGGFSQVNGSLAQRIARLNSDGSLDNTFSTGTGTFGGSIFSLAILFDGTIVASGSFNLFNDINVADIIKLNSNGSVALGSYGTYGVGIYDMVVQQNGKILICGDFTQYNSTTRNAIARLNSDLSLDTSFDPGTGPGSNGSLFSLAVQNDGKIIIGGWFTSFNGVSKNHVARLNSDGSVDNSFDAGTGHNGDYVNDIKLMDNQKLIVGGEFSSFNGVSLNNLVVLNNDGSIDGSFDPGTGPDGPIYSINIHSDDKILIGGGFSSYNGITRTGITRLNGEPTSNISELGANNEIPLYPNPASTLINVEMANASAIRLFDVNGKLLKEVNGASFYAIDVTDLTPGMYMIESAEGAKAKFIKE